MNGRFIKLPIHGQAIITSRLPSTCPLIPASPEALCLRIRHYKACRWEAGSPDAAGPTAAFRRGLAG